MSATIKRSTSLRKTRLGEIAEFIMGQAPPGNASNNAQIADQGTLVFANGQPNR